MLIYNVTISNHIIAYILFVTWGDTFLHRLFVYWLLIFYENTARSF